MPINCKNALSNMPSSTADLLENCSAFDDKLMIVGLYEVPNSDKTFLLNQLKQKLEQTHFAFYENSQMIAIVVSSDLDAFQRMEVQKKVQWRQCAIDTIKKSCVDNEQVAVVAEHFMF